MRKAGLLMLSIISFTVMLFGSMLGQLDNALTPLEAEQQEDKWENKADIPIPSISVKTVSVDGKIYAIGGGSANSLQLKTTFMYDPLKDFWPKMADMNFSGVYHIVVEFQNKIYAFGGMNAGASNTSSMEVYDPLSRAAATVLDNKIYSIGVRDLNIPTASLNTVFTYDPISKNWEEESELVKKADEIKARNFELVGMPENTLTFGKALEIAKFVAEVTGIRPAFLLAILQEELTLEKYDLGYLTNIETGEGVRFIDGKKMPKMMHPQRDIPGFLAICKELEKDPLKTLVTCPMSFGWGGAMGPADFIPSTWLLYKDDVEKITGKPADPWNISDAFLASGLFLSDSGAELRTRDGEWRAAMSYFSGSPDSGYNWYADSVLAIAGKLETDIETIEKSY